MRPTTILITIAIIYACASDAEHDDAGRRNAVWCQRVAEGTWHAGELEYRRRCAQMTIIFEGGLPE